MVATLLNNNSFTFSNLILTLIKIVMLTSLFQLSKMSSIAEIKKIRA